MLSLLSALYSLLAELGELVESGIGLDGNMAKTASADESDKDTVLP